MNTFVVDDSTVVVPSSVNDHASFREWARSEDFPETGQVCYLNGGVWVDMSKEQVFTHNQVKHEIAFVLTRIIREENLGRYFPDGVLLSNDDADLTAQPDGVFVASSTMASQTVRFVEGAQDGFVELEGSPDMVLEVVSRSSVVKDTVTLVDQYWPARIQEYWLVDARGQRLEFDILRRGAKGYAATKKQQGWMKSAAFDRWFRITRGRDEQGHPVFHLHVR
ncbi:MAG: Uma2 family endonuclease [Gemmataceae bacterium]|nr:Uma2 family endonuclease [Gemmataceae bacterium]